MSLATRPKPLVDNWNRPFWDACAKQELKLQRCTATGGRLKVLVDDPVACSIKSQIVRITTTHGPNDLGVDCGGVCRIVDPSMRLTTSASQRQVECASAITQGESSAVFFLKTNFGKT